MVATTASKRPPVVGPVRAYLARDTNGRRRAGRRLSRWCHAASPRFDLVQYRSPQPRPVPCRCALAGGGRFLNRCEETPHHGSKDDKMATTATTTPERSRTRCEPYTPATPPLAPRVGVRHFEPSRHRIPIENPAYSDYPLGLRGARRGRFLVRRSAVTSL